MGLFYLKVPISMACLAPERWGEIEKVLPFAAKSTCLGGIDGENINLRENAASEAP
jgi:hypothetical protein